MPVARLDNVDTGGGTETSSQARHLVPVHPGTGSRKQLRIQIVVLFALAAMGVLLLFRHDEIGKWYDVKEDVEVKKVNPSERASKRQRWGLPDAAAKPPSRLAGMADWLGRLRTGGDAASRRSPSQVRDALLAARDGTMRELLENDYGDFTSDIFNATEVRSHVFHTESSLSVDRLKRRLKMKVIEAQIRDSSEGAGNNGNDERHNSVAFTWATGGDSTAAAHGNLFRQSYTVAIEDAAKAVFDAAGVVFVAKSFGMGSSMSGPELGLCMESIYGVDLDILWWDFGMSDGRKNPHWYWLWCDRAGMHPTFPALFSLNQRAHMDMFPTLEQRGQTAFLLKDIDRARKLFPDSKANPDADKLPRAVAYYTCDGHPENNDVCSKHKFDVEWCEGVRFQVSWHPGWKDHLLTGRLSAVFLVDLLIEAVTEMVERDAAVATKERHMHKMGRRRLETNLSSHATQPTEDAYSFTLSYHRKLASEEKADRELFLNSDSATSEVRDGDKGAGMIDAKIWSDALLRGNPICHSMRLPSQARFDGLVDGVKAKRIEMGHLHTGVVDGYTIGTIPPPGPPLANDTQKSMIVGLRPPWSVALDQSTRHPYNAGPCNLTLTHDFRDAMVIRHIDGVMGDVFPTDREMVVMDRGLSKDGIVLICAPACIDKPGKEMCPPGTISLDNIGLKESGENATEARNVTERIEVEIDGNLVQRNIQINNANGQACYAMVGHGESLKFGPGGKNGRKVGQYEIKFRVSKPGGMALISSIIVA